jgi:hypothetical protein
MGYSPNKTSAPAPSAEKHEIHVHLDGKEIHASVVRRMIQNATFPRSAPYADHSRHWPTPDTGLVNI